MKKIVVILLILILATQMIWSYQPYDPLEFPSWTIKLRRAETITFGALPITFSVVGLSYGIARSLGSDPFYHDPLKDSLALLGIASVFAIGIALADYIIGEVRN